jgi:uncharacterized Zn-finger protein
MSKWMWFPFELSLWLPTGKCALVKEIQEGLLTVADHSIPHFHNDLGVQTIKVRVKEFMCTGAKPPFDHPHIFIDMGSDDEAICSYCSTRFVYDDALVSICAPPECEFRPAA